MSFSRATAVDIAPTHDELTEAMAGIGMNFAARANHDADIEATLVAASEQGMLHDDLRTLAVLVTWLGVHARLINADKLIRAVHAESSPCVRAFWSAFAKWQHKDRRFARLAKLHRGARVDVLAVGTDFQLHRHGEDPRFAGTALRVPANTLRDRPADVLDVAELAARHRTYRMRLMMGPSYRADMWAALEANPSMSPTQLAKKTLGSFATAWGTNRDWRLLHGDGSDASSSASISSAAKTSSGFLPFPPSKRASRVRKRAASAAVRRIRPRA
jgi:hypothetical protein